MARVLGISAFYHDSAAAIVIDGKIIAAAQEERFTRRKHTADFPANAITFCLDQAGLDIDDLDAVVFYDKPLLKFERLLQTYYAFAPKGLISFLKSIPIWLNEKLFLKRVIYNGLKEIGHYDKKKLKLLFSAHHLSHAASAFFASPYQTAAILTIDGVGEWSTASIGIGEGANIKILKEMEFPHSVGLLYSAFTYYLGFEVNSGEYKVMGLAPYGDPQSEETDTYISAIRTRLADIKEDGSLWLDQSYFGYATGLRMVNHRKWEELFGFKRRKPTDGILQHHCNLALAIQTVVEEVVFKMALEAKSITGADSLCLAGGVALNCVANGKLYKKQLFKNLFIQPAAGDAGGALGAALAVAHMYFDVKRPPDDEDQMAGSYLGPEYTDSEINILNRKTKAVYTKYESFLDLAGFIAEELAEGNIIGWFQGRMEFGPRALGNRSILADARNPAMQMLLNTKIKFRENFRPFAPSVLAEDVDRYFEFDGRSPYMLLTATVQNERRKALPENYHNLNLQDKIYLERSEFPAITHLDFSARLQTVRQEENPRYWGLINAFKNITGHGILLNTSFNVKDEPIVCSPTDAYRCFMNTAMDYLVIGDFVYSKAMQPGWGKSEKTQD
ncbi:nodulation protein [Parapedobacter defluvii]|uniref:Nodulation protein n=1 Tax=Parapedobacter defluvii TaxID=2045106 RepID=A0ABQ1N0B8_9SPHI|nr:carbamoyltransferase [Parapedobacter defluvii]GGC50165.1 nodulation protein [Parapedobacter defluvii]